MPAAVLHELCRGEPTMIARRLFSVLPKLAGAKDVAMKADELSFEDALRPFSEKYADRSQALLFDKQARLQPSLLLLLNGNVAQQKAPTPVRSADTVQMLLPTAGA